jgi:hypothetical protein
MSTVVQAGTYEQRYREVLRAAPRELLNHELVEVNLLCSQGLPGAEDLYISEYMERLHSWIGRVRRKTDQILPIFRKSPELFDIPPGTSESYVRMMILVSVLKREIGVHVNPARAGPHARGKGRPFRDSKDLLINGVLSSELRGTCNSIPYLVLIIGRRLGYPLKLATVPQHVWVRWEDGKERFNVDASCAGGMHSYPDEHYKNDTVYPLHPVLEATGCYLRSMHLACPHSWYHPL